MAAKQVAQATSGLTLVQKLKTIYEKIDHIEKRGKNKQQNYNYVKAADLAHAVRNAFTELGIYAEVNFSFINSFEFKTSSGTHMNGVNVQCSITFHDADDPTATKYTASGIGSGSDTTDKSAFKAQTGALKYALRNAFIVPDEADPENDSNEEAEEEVETVSRSEPRRERRPAPAQKPEPEPETEEETKPELPTASGQLAKDYIPQGEELDAIRNRYELLGKDLASAGLNSKGGTQGQKRLAYLLQVTGAPDAKQVTRNQWNTFFEVVSTVKSGPGIKELVKLVNEAAEKK